MSSYFKFGLTPRVYPFDEEQQPDQTPELPMAQASGQIAPQPILQQPTQQEDPYAKFAAFEVTPKEEDPYADFAAFEVKPKKRAQVTPVGPKDEGWFNRFGRALATQAATNAPQDLKAFTPVLSGATLGLSEKVPGLEVPPEYDDEYGNLMKFVGSVAPIEGLFFLNKPLRLLAEKSPFAAKQLGSLASIVQAGMVGAEYEALTHIVETGELPSGDDLIEHGASWAALDAALRTGGLLGRYGKQLLGLSKETGKSPFKLINENINEMRARGIEVENDAKVAAKALSILEERAVPTKGEPIKLTEKKVTPTEKVAQDAIKEHDVTPEALTDRKVSEEYFNKIEDIVPEQPVKPEVKTADELKRELIVPVTEEALDQYAKRKNTSQEVGKDIQKSLEQRFDEAKKTYDDFYAKARERSGKIIIDSQGVVNSSSQLLRELTPFRTQPGYEKAISILENFLDKLATQSGSGNYLAKSNINASEFLKLVQNLKEFADYRLFEKSIYKRLNPIVAQGKGILRDTLENQAPEAYKYFDQAEKLYGDTANKFKRKSIKKIRRHEYTEEIPKEAVRPTTMDDLKAILTDKQYKTVEREALQNLNSRKVDEAVRELREISGKLTPEAKKLGNQIVKSKAKPVITKPKELELSLTTALSKPERPKKFIDYWKTKQGNAAIREAVKSNPNKKEIIRYFEQQSMYDFASQFIGQNGKIDFEAFQQALKKQPNINAIREIGGQDAVNFFLRIGQLRKGIERKFDLFESVIQKEQRALQSERDFYEKQKDNVKKLYEKTPKGKALKEKRIAEQRMKQAEESLKRAEQEKRTRYGDLVGGTILQQAARKAAPIHFKIRDLFKPLGVNEKLLLGILGVQNIGYVGTVGVALAGKMMMKLAQRRPLRNQIQRLALQSTNNPAAFFSALDLLIKELEEE